MFAGVRFIRNNPAILGTISLDLFAVLFGGVMALLPIYARDILEAGPLGLGILRAAPAVGALLMTIVLARHSINRHIGLRMFQAVIVFGVATVVFALSQWMWLSVLALAVLGAADTISVVIRFSLVQLSTPDEMRGRVGAVNFLFINAAQPTRPVRKRRHRGAVRHGAGRRARRRRHHRDRAVVDEAVSVAAEGGAVGVGALDAQHVVAAQRRDRIPRDLLDVRHEPVAGSYRNQRRGIWVPAFAGTTPVSLTPRPTNGILLAMTVMNSTLASSGRPAM